MVPNLIPQRIYDEYLKNFKNPDALHAMCEDYRAGASIDMEHDEADLDKKVTCPMLVLWGARGAMEGRYDVLGIWRKRASNVEGHTLPGGHWLLEQVPHLVFEEVMNFIPE
jgi:haloacetate dehalogenase